MSVETTELGYSIWWWNQAMLHIELCAICGDWLDDHHHSNGRCMQCGLHCAAIAEAKH